MSRRTMRTLGARDNTPRIAHNKRGTGNKIQPLRSKVKMSAAAMGVSNTGEVAVSFASDVLERRRAQYRHAVSVPNKTPPITSWAACLVMYVAKASVWRAKELMLSCLRLSEVAECQPRFQIGVLSCTNIRLSMLSRV